MGRGAGKDNKSIAELKENKRERDADRYARDRKSIQKQSYERAKTALTINCGCGGHYKDLTKNKNSHFLTPKHSLWEVEQELNVDELVMSKYKNCKTIEDAHNKLITIYIDNDKYKATECERILPKIIKALKNMPDATPPPPLPPPPKKIKLKLKMPDATPPPPPPKKLKLKLKLKTSEP